jgi:putative ABC transport system permease protein
MTRRLPFRTALRIALREMRASWFKFLFVVLAVAAGVGALTGVRGFSLAFRHALLRDARTLMAGDLMARQFAMPDDNQIRRLDDLARRGVERTWITETFTMAAGTPGTTPVLVSVKAVDPAKYPYYGAVKLRPPMPLAQAIGPDSVAVGEDLLVRLKLNVGDPVRIGDREFRIAAVVESEPDRITGSLNIGLRLMMTRGALEDAGLLRLGSRAAQRFLFKMAPNAPPVQEVRKEIKATLPESLVSDFRQSHPIVTGGLDRSTMFLSLVSLMAVIVGALGVGMAMHAHLQQKLDTIGVMKSMGATSGQVIKIYVLQTLALGGAGAALGLALGYGVQRALPKLLISFLQLDLGTGVDWRVALQGLAVGILTTLLFTLPPLLSIRKMRPALILRRDMEEAKLPWRRRIAENQLALAAGLVILAGIGGIAWWLSESPRLALYFVIAIVAALLANGAVAWLLLRGIRVFLKTTRFHLPQAIRHGMANLYRQGNHAQTVLVALGLGVMFTLTVYLVQRSLIGELVRQAPPGMPNVYLIDITQNDAPGILALLEKLPGVLGKPELVPSVPAKLTKVNGVPVQELKLQGFARRFLQTRSVTREAAIPEMTKVLEGSWWKADEKALVVSVSEEASKNLDLHPGAKIEMMAFGRVIPAEVRAVHRTDAIRVTAANEFIFNPPALEGLPTMFYGGVRMQPDQVGGLQRAVFEKYPTVTVFNIADAVELIQQVIDQISLVIRFISAFAIFAGVIILAASVAGTRFRRIREVVILKTLGAARRRVAGIFSVEFLLVGGVAGLLGAILANVFANAVLQRFLDAKLHFEPWSALAATLGTALLAAFAGWLSSAGILRQKPLEALRNE